MKKTKTSDREQNPGKIVLSTHRVSYVHLDKPQAFDDGGEAKYSVTFLIPKKHPDVERVKGLINDIYKANKESVFNKVSLTSPNFHNPLRDGDEYLDEHPDNLECRGCYFVKAASKSQPAVYGSDKQEILDLDEVYSGCYCRGVIVGWPFNNKAKGISFFLNSVMFIKDGERLGGFESDPDDYDESDETDDDLL